MVLDHSSSDVQRSRSLLKRRSVEMPPFLYEQDTFGWALSGRIRIRSRRPRLEVDGADFLFPSVSANPSGAGPSLDGQSKMTVRFPLTKTRSSRCNLKPRAKASFSLMRPFIRKSAGVSL